MSNSEVRPALPLRYSTFAIRHSTLPYDPVPAATPKGGVFPVKNVPQVNPAPTAAHTTGAEGRWFCAAQATGNDAEPRLPVLEVSLQTRSGGNPSFKASKAGIRPLPPCATTAAS